MRITGFGRDAIRVEATCSNCLILGNCLVANGNAGLTISNAVASQIGGPAPADRNLISGNAEYGVSLQGPSCRANSILGNLIGPDASLSQAVGAQNRGIFLLEASDNAVGGTNSGEGNIIAFNALGVAVSRGTNNPIRANRIFANGEGIALTSLFGGNGDYNDPGDTDNGGNQLQNYPVLSNAAAVVGSTLVEGHLNSMPSQTYTLDFYTTAEDCTSFYGGQGEFFLGSAQVTTDAGGDVDFSVIVHATIQRRYLAIRQPYQ